MPLARDRAECGRDNGPPERCDTSREIANRAPRLRDHTWQVFGLTSTCIAYWPSLPMPKHSA